MNTIDILGIVAIVCVLIACIYIYTDTEAFQLKCVVSTVDGNKYCVREREQVHKAADLLATVTNKCKKLVEYVNEKHPDNNISIRLKEKFNPNKIMETLPTSTFTAFTENKGDKMAFCLNKDKKEGTGKMIDEHTLTFVAIHEMSHIATESEGHKTIFWDNFKFLLEQAKEAGLHDPADYEKNPVGFCGMKIQDSPYFNS